MISRERRAASVALASIVLLAGVLRFTGLSRGLRQAPDRDEALFVGSVVEMVRHHDFGQRFYEYPGLFFQILRAAFTCLPSKALGSAPAYLAARAVVAAFGTLSVLLAYLLGKRLVSTRGGIVAALALAVSPVEVTTAHMVRPDVVLETFALLLLLSLRLGRRPDLAGAGATGVALGGAAAVKVTGVALVPSVVLDWWLNPDRRRSALLAAGAASLLVLLVATPDLAAHPAAFARGFTLQWRYHYPQAPGRPISEATLPFYLRTLWEGLGPVACVLLVAGSWEATREFRAWGPLLVFPATLLALLLSSDVHWSRLLIPAFGPLCVVAARGFETVVRRLPRFAWAAALVGSLLPASTSVAFVRAASRPEAADLALDWIEAHVPRGGRVLTSVGTLGLDRARFEVFRASGVASADRRMAGMVDAAILGPLQRDLLAPSTPVLSLTSGSKVTGLPLWVFATPGSARRERARVPNADLRLTASSSPGELPQATDGNLDTEWKTDRADCTAEWVEVDLPREVRLASIDLALGRRPARAGRHVALWVPGEGTAGWRRVPAAVYRSQPTEGTDAPPENGLQVMVFDPTVVTRLRVRADCPEQQRWGFAEIRLYGSPED